MEELAEITKTIETQQAEIASLHQQLLEAKAITESKNQEIEKLKKERDAFSPYVELRVTYGPTITASIDLHYTKYNSYNILNGTLFEVLSTLFDAKVYEAYTKGSGISTHDKLYITMSGAKYLCFSKTYIRGFNTAINCDISVNTDMVDRKYIFKALFRCQELLASIAGSGTAFTKYDGCYQNSRRNIRVDDADLNVHFEDGFCDNITEYEIQKHHSGPYETSYSEDIYHMNVAADE